MPSKRKKLRLEYLEQRKQEMEQAIIASRARQKVEEKIWEEVAAVKTAQLAKEAREARELRQQAARKEMEGKPRTELTPDQWAHLVMSMDQPRAKA